MDAKEQVRIMQKNIDTDERILRAIRLMFDMIEALKSKHGEGWSYMVVLPTVRQPSIMFTELSSGQSGAIGMDITDLNEDLEVLAAAVYDQLSEFIEIRKAEACTAQNAEKS